jgi:hypothetical protein
MWPPSETRSNAVAQAAKVPLDWDRFLRVLARHRVVGFAQQALSGSVDVPPVVARSLADAARGQAHRNLLFARELVRLCRAFDDRSLAVTVFKGIPTALEIYGNLGMRESKDIDLLVAYEDMSEAEEILRTAGYQRVDPPENIGKGQLRTLLSIAKDFIYTRSDDPTIQVELHWRLFKNTSFMSGLADTARERTIKELSGLRLKTFFGDDQFAYLCAHGAAFAWSRLKWLADIGAWLSTASAEEIVRLHKSAGARGAARPAAQAILLCKRLLDARVPDDFAEELRRDPGVEKLETLALTAMLQGNAEVDLYDLPGGMRPIVSSEWLLRGDLSYLWGELNTRWIGWDDVIRVPLPAQLRFLYPVIRVPMWLLRRAAIIS